MSILYIFCVIYIYSVVVIKTFLPPFINCISNLEETLFCPAMTFMFIVKKPTATGRLNICKLFLCVILAYKPAGTVLHFQVYVEDKISKISIDPFHFMKCDIPVHVCLEDFSLRFWLKKYNHLTPNFEQKYLNFAQILHLTQRKQSS